MPGSEFSNPLINFENISHRIKYKVCSINLLALTFRWHSYTNNISQGGKMCVYHNKIFQSLEHHEVVHSELNFLCIYYFKQRCRIYPTTYVHNEAILTAQIDFQQLQDCCNVTNKDIPFHLPRASIKRQISLSAYRVTYSVRMISNLDLRDLLRGAIDGTRKMDHDISKGRNKVRIFIEDHHFESVQQWFNSLGKISNS